MHTHTVIYISFFAELWSFVETWLAFLCFFTESPIVSSWPLDLPRFFKVHVGGTEMPKTWAQIFLDRLFTVINNTSGTGTSDLKGNTLQVTCASSATANVLYTDQWRGMLLLNTQHKWFYPVREDSGCIAHTHTHTHTSAFHKMRCRPLSDDVSR